MTTPKDILDYWFEGGEHDVQKTQKLKDKWYIPSAKIDDEITTRFLDTFQQAEDGELEDWKDSLTSCLALVIIFDQFPRNLFRKTARAFETDIFALELSYQCINNFWHEKLPIPHQLFLFNPFQHSETLTDQERGVSLVQQLHDSCDPSWREYVSESLEFFRAHRDTIARFGRFPHRNEVLGRESTAEEIEFLKSAPRYGQ